jgi:uncharacterized protein (DUF4213/DUF364 family)
MVSEAQSPFLGLVDESFLLVEDIKWSQRPNHRFWVSWTRVFSSSGTSNGLRGPITVFKCRGREFSPRRGHQSVSEAQSPFLDAVDESFLLVEDIKVSQRPNHRFWVSWTRVFSSSGTSNGLRGPFTVFECRGREFSPRQKVPAFIFHRGESSSKI